MGNWFADWMRDKQAATKAESVPYVSECRERRTSNVLVFRFHGPGWDSKPDSELKKHLPRMRQPHPDADGMVVSGIYIDYFDFAFGGMSIGALVNYAPIVCYRYRMNNAMQVYREPV